MTNGAYLSHGLYVSLCFEYFDYNFMFFFAILKQMKHLIGKPYDNEN